MFVVSFTETLNFHLAWRKLKECSSNTSALAPVEMIGADIIRLLSKHCCEAERQNIIARQVIVALSFLSASFLKKKNLGTFCLYVA